MIRDTTQFSSMSHGRVATQLRALLAVVLLISLLPGAAASVDQLPFIGPVLGSPQPQDTDNRQGDRHEFTLRNIFHHGTYMYPSLHNRFDVKPGAPVWIEAGELEDYHTPIRPLFASSQPARIQRLADRSFARIDALLDAGRERGQPVDLPVSAWAIDNIKGPNYTDRETVISFARMSADAYVLEPSAGDWEKLGHGFNYTHDFGWQNDGIRGHIFADTTNKTIVIALKGTSPAVFDGEGTTTKDKENDNLFFGCCCGQGSIMWHKSCDCQSSTYTCNSTCVAHNLRKKNRYYYAAKELYNNVTELYPESQIWLTGHSLGGAMASLLANTYGNPVITFASPGDAMPAKRLGLPTPPGYRIGDIEWADTGSVHFGHTADPIYMGECNGVSSICSIGGYSMEAMCHTGRECIYNTRKDLGWLSRTWNHGIKTYLRDVLEKYNETAKCYVREDCTDCFLWKFFESNHSDTTTTKVSTSSYSRTRTATCQTPGWWGCLDETTTTGPITTTTTTTSTCKTPGWFRCLDESTTVINMTSTTVTSTCHTPGWIYGCRDETTTSDTGTTTTTTHTAKPAPTITTTTAQQTSTTSTCKHPGFFWGCYDTTSASPGATPTTTVAPTSPPSTTDRPVSTTRSCAHPGIFWGCWDDWGWTAATATMDVL